MDSAWTNPSLSSQPLAYDMQGDEAEVGPQGLFICLHACCDHTFPNEIALGNHIGTYHAPVPITGIPAALYAHEHVNHGFDVDLFAQEPTFALSPGFLLDTASTFQPIAGFEDEITHPNATVYPQTGLNYYATYYNPTGQDNYHTQGTLGFAQTQPNTYLTPSTATEFPLPTSQIPASTTNLTPTIPSAASIPAPRIHCTHPTCPQTYIRQADMLRHARKHSSSAERFSCDVAGCKYKGSMGFLRMDKLRSHRRTRHGI